MTDQPIYDAPPRSRNRTQPPTPRRTPAAVEAVTPRSEPKALNFWITLDKPLLVIVALLLAIGAGMVYSTTFDWSYQERGSNTAFFLEDHMRNVVIGLVSLVFFAVIDYRFWRRFTMIVVLIAIAALAGVLLFGDDTFGARRSLISGRLQPGELSAFAIVMYMSAWLGSRNVRPDSLFALIWFVIVVGIIAILLAIQPDLSTAIIVAATALVMYFLAGARLEYLAVIVVVGAIGGFIFVEIFPYAQERLSSYVESLADPTRANYHTQQAISAFVNGGWLGRGLGQSEQKFGALPAPHTDSIFAVIGEELGVVGAAVVLLLFIAFVARGFQIARRSVDTFGALMVIGFTMWIAIQALLNIGVMTAVVPSSGLPLPFISYGGSSLLVLMTGVGLMLSVSRVSQQRANISNRSRDGATYDWGWGNRRSRLSRTDRRRSAGADDSA
jgi:cell division protein FtsW